MDRARRVQGCQHSVLLRVGRVERVLRLQLLLDYAFLDEILVCWVAERDYAPSQTVRVVLGLQLHLLLLVHLDGVQTVFVQVWRLVAQLLR